MKKIFIEKVIAIVLTIGIGVIANAISNKVLKEEKKDIKNKIEINCYFYNNSY